MAIVQSPELFAEILTNIIIAIPSLVICPLLSMAAYVLLRFGVYLLTVKPKNEHKPTYPNFYGVRRYIGGGLYLFWGFAFFALLIGWLSVLNIVALMLYIIFTLALWRWDRGRMYHWMTNDIP